ncbi:hypothetical protein CVT24_011674 [Panaeolus cyanescens]|uniref:Uncharacterized protein n=1 Tax=Panaeolus cyanescens TaxID=181874 RepID=A0A409YH39_9AGAR|nr:hypothetical protein CVT24_011674 [Panaeolus cyanescens]
MRFLSLTALGFLSGMAAVSASPYVNIAHSDEQPKIDAQDNVTSRALEKRFTNAMFTFFDASVGQGACGRQNTNADHIVALNAQQWDAGSHCFEEITIIHQYFVFPTSS